MKLKSEEYKSLLLLMIAYMVLLRLLLLATYPLMDTTEARYAEIARKMVELNDWITPWFDYGVPFWGKPPLSFWMTAISFKLFGINEFAARLPHYLCGVVIAYIIWIWMRRRSQQESVYTIAILSGAFLYFASSGLVMTDMWMLLGTILSMYSFWCAVKNDIRHPIEPWLFFIGLAIGLLAKGPVTLVLTGLPIAAWLLATKNYALAWRSLPWLRGSVLMTVIAVPWYIVAEMKTPGFLNYFIVGEHFHRFVTPGWTGDLYGSAHHRPRGTIWWYLFVDGLPWSILFPVLFALTWKKNRANRFFAREYEWHVYLLAWGLAPAIFFTFAGNILWPYLLPGFPALAILLAGWLENQKAVSETTKSNMLLGGLAFTSVMMMAFIISLPVTGAEERKSARSFVGIYNSHKQQNETLYYYSERPFSAAFYTDGKAGEIKNPSELQKLIDAGPGYLAVRQADLAAFSDELRNNLKPVASQHDRILLRMQPSPAVELSDTSETKIRPAAAPAEVVASKVQPVAG